MQMKNYLTMGKVALTLAITFSLTQTACRKEDDASTPDYSSTSPTPERRFPPRRRCWRRGQTGRSVFSSCSCVVSLVSFRETVCGEPLNAPVPEAECWLNKGGARISLLCMARAEIRRGAGQDAGSDDDESEKPRLEHQIRSFRLFNSSRADALLVRAGQFPEQNGAVKCPHGRCPDQERRTRRLLAQGRLLTRSG